jgi:hypothetical protein
VNLADVRPKLAAALTPIADDDPDVHADYVDALAPPCLLVTWADPWLESDTACLYAGRPQIIAVAGRLTPGPGVETLERLIGYVAGRLAVDAVSWPITYVSSPRVFEIGGVSYLGARIELAVKITTT